MGDHCSHDPGLQTGSVLDLDEVLDILSREIRRDVISFCRGRKGQGATFDDLVDHVATQRRRRSDTFDTLRIEAKLHHVHLPRLSESGVIDYDSRSGDVRYWGDERLETCLDRIDEL